jgi:hypothetical protein
VCKGAGGGRQKTDDDGKAKLGRTVRPGAVSRGFGLGYAPAGPEPVRTVLRSRRSTRGRRRLRLRTEMRAGTDRRQR